MNATQASLQKVPPKHYLFGRFVLDLERLCLMRDGQEIKLRPKSFELLRHLVENRGRVVMKEELIKAVWPDSFVTDDSLVQCVIDIRRALDGNSQQFIKTVPRRGYIFEAVVCEDGAGANGAIHGTQPDGTTVSLEEESIGDVSTPTGQPEAETATPARMRWRWIGAGSFVLAAVLGFVGLYPRPKGAPPVWNAIPFTSYPGIERSPELSPDGSTVAFIWNGETKDNFDIYIRRIGSTGPPQRLTTHPAEDTSPAWSPNGRTIAFLRRIDGSRSELVLIPAAGGHESRLAEIRNNIIGGNFDSTLRRNLAWTPDGQSIAVTHSESAESPHGLFLVSLSTNEIRPLTQPPAGRFDEDPAFSPDGRVLAFARHPGRGFSDLYLQPLSKDFLPAGQEKRLTSEGRASHPVWTSDGNRIIYVSVAKGSGELRMIAPSTPGLSQPVREDSDIADLSIGRHLVYSRITFDTNVWRAEIPSSDGPDAVPQLLISSTRGDTSPRYSPDSKKVAFISGRSGKSEIWICNPDGSNPVQLTSFNGLVYFPNWSPDSQRLVFHARLEGQADLFSIPAAGGSPQRLTTDPSDDLLASYSHDGQWIYFTSNRSGQSEIWKMAAEGGEATRITHGGAHMPFESPDGKTIFYAHSVPEKGIWKVPVHGGDAVQVTSPVAKDAAFAVSPDGVYYVTPPESPTRQLIHFLSFSTRESRPVVATDREIGQGLSLSPDQRFLIFAQRDQTGSDLMLVEDFVPPW